MGHIEDDCNACAKIKASNSAQALECYTMKLKGETGF